MVLAENPARLGGDDEAAHAVVGHRPDDRHVGDRSVGDPHLAAVEDPVRPVAPRPGGHRSRIGAGVGFGQAEAAEQFAGGHAGQPLLLLFFGAESPDREHGQRPLYRDHRPDAGVGGLQLGTRQPVVHRRRPAAAVTLQVHAEQSELTEVLGQVADREIADLEPLRDVRDDVLGAELTDRVTHRDLVVGQ